MAQMERSRAQQAEQRAAAAEACLEEVRSLRRKPLGQEVRVRATRADALQLELAQAQARAAHAEAKAEALLEGPWKH